MRKFFKRLTTFLLSAVLASMLMPYVAIGQLPGIIDPAPNTQWQSPYESPGPNYTLVCTFQGFSWVKTSDTPNDDVPAHASQGHCVLCYASPDSFQIGSAGIGTLLPMLAISAQSLTLPTQPTLVTSFIQTGFTRGPPAIT